MAKLKPCPFCGGEAEFTTEFIEFIPHLFFTDSECIYIRCKECKARSDIIMISSSYYSAQEKVIEKWNRRAEE